MVRTAVGEPERGTPEQGRAAGVRRPGEVEERGTPERVEERGKLERVEGHGRLA